MKVPCIEAALHYGWFTAACPVASLETGYTARTIDTACVHVPRDYVLASSRRCRLLHPLLPASTVLCSLACSVAVVCVLNYIC